MTRLTAGWVLLLALLVSVGNAEAFCGFYVSGADAELFNNATLVVLMRDGTRTVLSMQNNYQGPPENFAMVVPVPEVLKEDNVKTLPRSLFDRVDRLSAPRLVEYWEQDPCKVGSSKGRRYSVHGPAGRMSDAPESATDKLGVKIEAQFTVGEYDIVILSASDSAGLDTWLKQQGYKIPDGAEPFLKPYVQQGMKFFVAKVDVSKVTMKDGQAMLSPLRFHYDDEQFRLPIRLGLINSKGKQDLIVNILARGQRYEAANYENAVIATNIDLDQQALTGFGAFYAALFDATLDKHGKAVVTEYSWDSGSCDPCPVPALQPAELALLGADVIDVNNTPAAPSALPGRRPTPSEAGRRPVGAPTTAVLPRPVGIGRGPRWGGGFVLTRLHARYDSSSLGEDLVFQKAGPIAGGREFPRNAGRPVSGSEHSSINQFQARYAVRHRWQGAVSCEHPVYGVWGGPPQGGERKTLAATDLAFAPRGQLKLASLLQQDIPELALKSAAVPPPNRGQPAPSAAPAASAAEPTAPAADSSGSNCGCTLAGQRRAGEGQAGWLLALLAFGWRGLAARRRRIAG